MGGGRILNKTFDSAFYVGADEGLGQKTQARIGVTEIIVGTRVAGANLACRERSRTMVAHFQAEPSKSSCLRLLVVL